MSQSREIVKEYAKGELTVLWKPKICIHSGECVKRLPEVYNPDKRPWINVENASTEELREQIEACPSGALSYRMEGEDTFKKDKKMENSSEKTEAETKVEIIENGPLMVYGTLKVTDAGGNTETKKRTTAFCRCGASGNKPYCDGAHNGIDFKG